MRGGMSFAAAKVAAGTLVAFLALSACSGGSASTPATSSGPASTATSAPSASGVSVASVASKVAVARTEIDALASDLAPCGAPDGVAGATTCRLVIAPAELTDLISRTRSAAQAIGAEDISGCPVDSEEAWPVECAAASLRVRMAVEDLQHQLAGWSAYGG